MTKVTVDVKHPRLFLGGKRVPVGHVSVDENVAEHWIKKKFAVGLKDVVPVEVDDDGPAKTAELDPAKLEVATPDKKRGRPAKAE